MGKFLGKYIKLRHAFSALTFFICSLGYSQNNALRIDSLAIRVRLSKKPDSHALIPYISPYKDRNTIFLDSLRSKASKNRITRKLFDFVIVAHGGPSKRNFEGESESAYIGYSGKKIRKIDVTRLSVFGSDIENPSMYKGSKAQNLLNRTHVNTLDAVIRNNLLFGTGDTISPIVLSENERLLRDLSFIDDARINVIPVSQNEADIQIITKDVYSLGGDYSPSGLTSGTVSVFDNNLFGLGHEFGFEVPFDPGKPDSPGIGLHYTVDNVAKSFINLKVFYYDALGEESYGVNLNRKFISSTTKYAGGISGQHTYKFIDFDTLTDRQPFKYDLQDFWLARSFLLDPATVTRFIIAGRYMNNNVIDRPFILPDSYHSLQKYRMFMTSLAFSRQRYYKSNLVYGYGRTEDVPYGSLVKVTAGREINEFKTRSYAGSEISFGKSLRKVGYVYLSTGFGAYINNNKTEQGIVYSRVRYFSNLLPLGRNMIRNFVRIDFTRGFDRNLDEYLKYYEDNGFSGFRNDSIRGRQRISLGLESILFSPMNLYGFRFAFFGFADFSALSGTNQTVTKGTSLSGIGLGIRVRNDNLIFNTFQLRLGFFPNPPSYSRINYVTASGESPLRMDDFETGPPAAIPYR
ncbi:MAG TPA: hypothetical protein VHO46_09365 [Bacteroidales bacterium]|nr:hypothetical protein [Bacteroidales bacterium]